MARSVEIEVKFVAAPAMVAVLRAHPLLAGDGNSQDLTSTYFDTVDGKLRSCGAALRIREGDGRREQTLKFPGEASGRLSRHEWTVPAPVQGPPAVAEFHGRARMLLAQAIGDSALLPYAVVRTDRAIRRLSHRSCTIEAALDLVEIEAGGHREHFCELELELMAGRFADLLDLADALPLGPDLRWSIRSKAERAQNLALCNRPKAAKARGVNVSKTASVAEGVRVFAWNCLEQLLANYVLVVESADPEALHQCRVALRRLASVLKLFREIVEDQDFAVIRAECAAVAKGLGPARELMLITQAIEAAAGRAGEDAQVLLAHLAQQRAKADAVAQDLLGGEPFQRLLLRLALWIEAGRWSRRHGNPGRIDPLAGFAAHALDRQYRRVRRGHRRLADKGDRARHRLRIEVKRMRYATAFFLPLFADDSPPRPARDQARKFVRKVERLQNILGELNDMVVAAEDHAALFAEIEPIAAAGLMAQFDELLAIDRKKRSRLIKAADKALDRLGSLPVWWKADKRDPKA